MAWQDAHACTQCARRIPRERHGTLSPIPDPDPSPMRIITFNANGIRSAANKGFFDWLRKQDADVVCLQETKAQEDQLTDPMFRPDGHHCFYRDATTKKGYSGVAIYAKREPDEVRTALGWAPFDDEGPLHRGALRQSQRGVAVRAVGLVGRGAPGVQVQGRWSGSSRCSTAGSRAGATTCSAATGTSCAAGSTSRTGRRTRRTPAACRPSATGSTACCADEHRLGRQLPRARIPRARTTPGGATAAPRARRTSAGASTTRSCTPCLRDKTQGVLDRADAALLRPRALHGGLRAVRRDAAALARFARRLCESARARDAVSRFLVRAAVSARADDAVGAAAAGRASIARRSAISASSDLPIR